MKIAIEKFQGEYPRVAPQLLPMSAAAVALNGRFLSGDLESWKDMLEITPAPLTKGGNINTIALMAGQYWLHWKESELSEGQTNVDVARGPIAQDVTERTIFTGVDEEDGDFSSSAPRVTNLDLALTTVPTPPDDYPLESWKLGVPAPELAPSLAIINDETAEGEVVLNNLDAEEGDTSNWDVTAGDLNVFDDSFTPPNGVTGLGTAAVTSTFFFGGSLGAPGATTIAQYGTVVTPVVLSDNAMAPGQSWDLSWYQASGANNSSTTVDVSWYSDAYVTLIETSTTGAVAIAADNTWVAKTLDGTIPATATHMRIQVTFTNGGAGDNDAYIDEMTLVVANSSYSYSGDTLDGLTTFTAGGGAVVVDATFGYPAPSIKFSGENAEYAAVYANYAVDTATSYTVEADVLLDSSDSDDGNFTFLMSGGVSGSGTGVNIGGNRVELVTMLGWGAVEAVTETLYAGDTDGEKIHVSITVTKTTTTTATADILITNVSDTLVLFDGTKNISINGGYLGWRFRGDGGTDDIAWLDNWTINITQGATSDNQVNTFTAYVYTYVNPYGEEGPPSPVSRTIQFPNNGAVVVTTDTTGPDDPLYGIQNPTPANAGGVKSTKRIYRAVTAAGTTSFLFVAEIDLDVAVFNDNLDDDQLGEELQTVDWDLPPTDGFGIVALPNGTMMMASKNQLCPSVQNHMHAYPENYRLNFDSTVVAIAAIDTSVIVGTDTYPYLVIGSDPSQLSSAKFEQRQACVSKRSMVSVRNYGVIYASPDGLVAINAAGGLEVITDRYFSRREWQTLKPESIIGFCHDDRYFGFYDNEDDTPRGFIFDPREGGNGLTWVDFYGRAGYSDPRTDIFYLVRNNNELHAWDHAEDTLLAYDWTSKLFQLPRPASFNCMQVKADDYGDPGDLRIRILSNGTALTWPDTGLAYRDVLSETEFVIPENTTKNLQLRITGIIRVRLVEIAEEMGELT